MTEMKETFVFFFSIIHHLRRRIYFRFSHVFSLSFSQKSTADSFTECLYFLASKVMATLTMAIDWIVASVADG